MRRAGLALHDGVLRDALGGSLRTHGDPSGGDRLPRRRVLNAVIAWSRVLVTIGLRPTDAGF